jgi:Trk K+ transport system NAD-binding subunit
MVMKGVDIIVSGGDALAAAIIEGLQSAGAHVVRLVDDDVADTPDDLAEAGIADATAVVCAGNDDAVNLEIALLARKSNPDVRVVARVSNDVLREGLYDAGGPGVFLDVAELAAPSIVEACLAHTTHSFEAAGVKFLVSGTEAARDATLRDLYGDLAPVAVLRGENSHTPGQTEVCPGRDLRVNAGDWTAMIGTADELAARGTRAPRPTRSRSPRRVLRRFFDAARALQNDVNPAVYPTMIALLILVVGSTTLLHFSYQPQFKLTWVDAFYFTAETITTTGYGDFSFTGQSIWLRLFAAMLMFGGVFNIALLVAFIADVLLSRRFVYSVGRPRVRHLRNHIIVVGLSALGTRVVTDLTALGYDVAVIELDQDNRFLSSVAELDVPVIFGDATLRQTLESARVDRARAVAVLTRNEVVNIETGIVLAKMVGRRLTPEVIRPEIPLVLRVYDRALGLAVAQQFGFINVRSTVELAAPWFISAAIGLDVLGTFSVGQSSFVAGEMRVESGSELDGMRMFDLSTKTRVIAITQPDAPVNLHPRRDAQLQADDTVYLVGPYRELLETLRKGQAPQQPGGGDDKFRF